jgi:HJR/Mrr/RecB family endonuclease
MDGRFFEAVVATLWRRQQYDHVHLTPRSDDGGVDVVAIRGAEGVLIQCKSSSREGAQLGWDAIKEVVGGTAIYAERYPGVRFKPICVTNQSFNMTARERARANRVELIEQDRLVELLARHPLTMLEVSGRL